MENLDIEHLQRKNSDLIFEKVKDNKCISTIQINEKSITNNFLSLINDYNNIQVLKINGILDYQDVRDLSAALKINLSVKTLKLETKENWIAFNEMMECNKIITKLDYRWSDTIQGEQNL